MLGDLGVVDCEQALELVHLYLEHLELVGEQLLETLLHEVLE